MRLVTVGMSHETAPVEIREQSALSEPQAAEALATLLSVPGIQESLIISTCNRVEACAVVKDPAEGSRQLMVFFQRYRPGLVAELPPSSFYTHTDEAAVRHLFRVASSLDSMVMGEPQILGQIKAAYTLARQRSATGVILNRLCQRALAVAKKVRTQTGIAERAVSVSFAAIELAKKILGRLHDKTVLLIGAGEMAELAARHLIKGGIGRILITTRRYQRAADLAAVFNGRAVRFEEFSRELAGADIVIASTLTKEGEPLLTEADLHRVIAARKNHPIFLIDIGVPRNIDPAVGRIPNVFLYNIDDLKHVVDENRQSRAQEAVKAEAICAEEAERFLAWMQTLEAVPTIVALKAAAERIRQEELARLLARCPDLSETDRDRIAALTTTLVNRLLHAPLTRLKRTTESADGTVYLEAARRFFGLDADENPAGEDQGGEDL